MTRMTGMRPLRIAFVGQKGIPARYGGVETHVEAISTRLAQRGHDVWVFCRSRFRPRARDVEHERGYRIEGKRHTYLGVRLEYRSSIQTKHLDAASHTFFCALEAGIRHGFDVVHFHGIGPAAFAPVAGLFGRKVVSTFHALDWRQVKWGRRAKRMLLRGEELGARKSDGIIAVSKLIQKYVRENYGVNATHIPNGATIAPPRGKGTIGQWGLDGDDYILTVGRIIPDRELHTLIDAFKRLEGRLRLVIVGSETPAGEYFGRLRSMADGRVIFTGDQFGDTLEDLYANCRMFVLASRVEGLPITVCEAMAHRRPVVLSDIAENLEVGGEAAKFFKCGSIGALEAALRALIDSDSVRGRLAEAGFERARTIYNWDLVADQVESFYYEIVGR